ncbi:PHD finger protein 7-like [Struthio camelus]|uniref:PHD finger protein 7-like n=1 Tax=Struthio camelus TaxID=8801 RepID=UPI00360422B0
MEHSGEPGHSRAGVSLPAAALTPLREKRVPRASEQRLEEKPRRGCGRALQSAPSTTPALTMKRKAPDSSEKAAPGAAPASPRRAASELPAELLRSSAFQYLASGLLQRGTDQEGICGFLPADIRRTIKSAAQKSCFVCGERGAAIACQQEGCSRSFHLPCASENGCVTQFFREYKSFCSDHRPQQTVQVSPDGETPCIICMEQLEDQLSFGTMVCPVCQGAWFHRACVQGQAFSAGRACFRCPQCQNKRKFLAEMLKMGIMVPFRLPTWEEDGHFDELYERHSRCDAGRCLYRRGREQAEESGR